MISNPQSNDRKLLVYEPRVEGHHPGWLRFITEDLLSADYELALAVDLREKSRLIIEEHLGDLIKHVELIPAVDENGKPRCGSKAASIVDSLNESGASRAFLCAFDELASTAFRRAALGVNLPRPLHGRIGGIYHRPRFTDAPWWSPNRWLKAAGFRKLMTRNWIRPLLFVDEYLAADFRLAYPDRRIHFLPDPCPDDFAGDPSPARSALGIPDGPMIFLFFGVGARRKGLHLAVEAMLRLESKDTFLLVAGRQNPPPRVRAGIDRLVRQNRALLMDRYVSSTEEKLCFQASDVVLLPYLHHFGTSGILSRAMATGKPVIASDEQLLGRLVRDNDVGWRFASGNVAGLAGCLTEASESDPETRKRFKANATAYANRYSRNGYRKALIESLSAR
jgi:glycosyltransferase involved in cell wall biosynthesis